MRGLYAITPNQFSSIDTLLGDVEAALSGGAIVIQYRDKHSVVAEKEEVARRLLQLCRQHDALFIINDDVELANRVSADGVHLGQDDMSVESARQQLGNDRLIGVSCYDSIERAQQAASDGADYVAFGRFFASRNKPEARQVSLEVLAEARKRLSVPIVAIGGITAQNGAPLIEAGADMLAVIDGVFGQADITMAARGIAALFEDKSGKTEDGV